jgi:hypothetical protein
MPVIKLNISLEDRVAKTLKRRARERAMPASRYIADLIEKDEKRELDTLAEEGYRLLSGDISQVDPGAYHMIRETLPPWEDEDTEHGTNSQPG